MPFENDLFHLKPYSIHIVIAYTLTFIELASELLFPLFLGILINEGIMADDMKQIYFWGTVMLFITALTFAAGIVNSFYAAHISVQFAYSLRERLFSHIQRFTFEQLAKIPSSALIALYERCASSSKHDFYGAKNHGEGPVFDFRKRHHGACCQFQNRFDLFVDSPFDDAVPLFCSYQRRKHV